MKTLKKVLYWIVFFLVAALILGFLLEIVNRGTAAATSVYDDFYPVIEELNRSAPITIEPGIRFEGASVSPSTGVRYRYTLTKLYPDRIDLQAAIAIREEMRDYNVQNSCTHPDIAPAIRAGVVFDHIYYDAFGQQFIQITVDRRICQAAQHM